METNLYWSRTSERDNAFQTSTRTRAEVATVDFSAATKAELRKRQALRMVQEIATGRGCSRDE